MKRILFAMLIGIACIAASCSKDEKDGNPVNYSGSIYGIVTDSKTAEPLRAVGVELYIVYASGQSLLLKTVTFDDGHFEFDDLMPNSYKLVIKAEDYEEAEYKVTVEAGRTARADMQISKLQTHLTVITLEVENPEDGMLTFNGTFSYSDGYFPDEVGFIYGQSEPLDESNGTLIKADVNSPFSCTVSAEELKTGTWYVRAFAKNKGGYELGQVRIFEIKRLSIVQTLEATNISETTATLNGLIVYKGEPEYTEKGFVYSSSFPMPTLDDPDDATTKVSVSGNSDEFSANISGLVKDQTYRVRAYAKSNDGVVYGDAVSFEATSFKPYIILENLAIQLTDLSSIGVSWYVAVDLCSNSRVGGFSDWRLPTVAELVLIYANRAKIGGFKDARYWSSSPYSKFSHYFMDFSNGETGDYFGDYRVRAVRTVK